MDKHIIFRTSWLSPWATGRLPVRSVSHAYKLEYVLEPFKAILRGPSCIPSTCLTA